MNGTQGSTDCRQTVPLVQCRCPYRDSTPSAWTKEIAATFKRATDGYHRVSLTAAAFGGAAARYGRDPDATLDATRLSFRVTNLS